MKKILFIFLLLGLIGAGCASSDPTQESNVLTIDATPSNTLTDILAAHDIQNPLTPFPAQPEIEYPWQVVETIDSPSGEAMVIIFGDDQLPDDPNAGVVRRGFYVLHGTEHHLDNFFMPIGAWFSHMRLGTVIWQDEETITYEFVTVDEGGEVIDVKTLQVTTP